MFLANLKVNLLYKSLKKLAGLQESLRKQRFSDVHTNKTLHCIVQSHFNQQLKGITKFDSKKVNKGGYYRCRSKIISITTAF
jgi:hypothetical protein